jgi:hypothetical protein
MKIAAAPIVTPLLLLLAACGEDDGEGGAPDLFLGFSGIVIAVVVIWLIVRAVNKSR